MRKSKGGVLPSWHGGEQMDEELDALRSELKMLQDYFDKLFAELEELKGEYLDE